MMRLCTGLSDDDELEEVEEATGLAGSRASLLSRVVAAAEAVETPMEGPLWRGPSPMRVPVLLAGS